MSGIWVVLVLAAVVASNYATNALGSQFYGKSTVKIYDLMHENIPDLSAYSELNDLLVAGLAASVIFVPQPLRILTEFADSFLLILIIRCFTIVSTILPKESGCQPQNSWIQLLKGQCYDKIFSGHISFVFLATLIYLRENLISFPVFILLNVVQASSILLTRSHYTVDVILGVVITYLVWKSKLRLSSFFRS
jgi:hypothetical protein